MAAGQLTEEGLDHVSVALTDDLQLSPDAAELGPCVVLSPVLVTLLLSLSRPVLPGPGGAVHHELPGLPGLPLTKQTFDNGSIINDNTSSTASS